MACVHFLLTSRAEIVLIDLDHEFSINIPKNATVHPVRHKPEESTGKAQPVLINIKVIIYKYEYAIGEVTF